MLPTTHCIEVFTADDDMFYDFMRESSEEERLSMLKPKLFKFNDITDSLAQLMFDCWIREPNVVHAVLYEDWDDEDYGGNVVDRWDIIEYQQTPSSSAINEFIEDELKSAFQGPSNGSPLLDKWALRCENEFGGIILDKTDIGGIWSGGGRVHRIISTKFLSVLY